MAPTYSEDLGFESDLDNGLDDFDLAAEAPLIIDDSMARAVTRKGMQPVDNRVPKDFVFIKQIGEGAFSTVYRAREVQSGNEYAIKTVVKAHVQKNQKTRLIVREKNLMALLTYVHGGHPNVVSLYCTFQDNDRLYFALSYCARGDMLDTLNKVGCFDQDIARFYSAEIVAALNFIHKCGVVHRDLKPENILFKDDGHIAITDFGSAKLLEEERRHQLERAKAAAMHEDENDENEDRERRRATFVGTAQYVSPEMLIGDAVGIECDYWALGAILFQMLSGQPPFRAVNDYHLLKKIQLLDFTFPPGFPTMPLDLVNRLLVLNPMKRLGSAAVGKVENHPYYKDINFETLHKGPPPEIHPYVPASFGEPEFYSDMAIEPGLDEKALSRLMMLNLTECKPIDMETIRHPLAHDNRWHKEERAVIESIASIASPTAPPPGHEPVETAQERLKRIRAEKLEKQRNENIFHKFVEDNLILRSGLVDKKKGLFARRRMFLLTEGPHIYYVDPVAMEYKGEIPFGYEIRTEAKNFRTFFVHTPNRTYYLFDPTRNAQQWCEAIDKVRGRYFKNAPPPNPNGDDAKKKKKKRRLPSWNILLGKKKDKGDKETKEKEKNEKKEKEKKEKKEKKGKAKGL